MYKYKHTVCVFHQPGEVSYVSSTHRLPDFCSTFRTSRASSLEFSRSNGARKNCGKPKDTGQTW